MTDVEYDLDQVTFYDSINPYHRFRDLLPILDHSLLPDHARFTPTVHATSLGKLMGMEHLYIKNETVLPSRSTKDRMAAVSLAYLQESGELNLITSSTGNSSTAYAYALPRFPNMKLCIVTAEAFARRVQASPSQQLRHIVLEDASFVDAANFTASFGEKERLTPEMGFFNPGRREGLKLAWLEAVEQVPRPIDWYVQAVSSAMGVYGVFKAAKELQDLKFANALPRLLCVQQASCAPMARAWAAGHEKIDPQFIVDRPSGIAASILRGNPSKSYPYIRRIVLESGGAIKSVGEEEIREARLLVRSREQLDPCYTASAAVAGLIAAVHSGLVSKRDTVLVNLSGADRPQNTGGFNGEYFARDGNDWQQHSVVPGQISQ